MGIDVTAFNLVNVVDTCSVWNVLSSKLLYGAAREAGCEFCITTFVHYECLIKPRKTASKGLEEQLLMDRLKAEQDRGRFKSHSCDIADLQQLATLAGRKRLGKGELSAVAFAMKINQAVLTDDQGARRFSASAGCRSTQTTPQLFGWLVFTGRLGHVDKSTIVEQHETTKGPLRKYLDDACDAALQCRLNLRTPSA